jgi:hypothetical protein
MEIIKDKVGLRSVTIWTALAQVTLCTTSVANTTLGTLWLRNYCLVLFWLACRLLSLRVSFLLLATVVIHCAGQTRSNRLGGGLTTPGQHC